MHEVTPYSEIYGKHPREFVFDRHGDMIPAAGRFGFVALGAVVGPEDEDDDEHDAKPGVVSDEKEPEAEPDWAACGTEALKDLTPAVAGEVSTGRVE